MRHGYDNKTVEKHPEAHDYILRLIAECERQLVDGKQPHVSYGQIEEWYKLKPSLLICYNRLELKRSSFHDFQCIEYKHEAVIAGVDELITTLKLIHEDYMAYRITETQLSNLKRLALGLSQCRERIVFY